MTTPVLTFFNNKGGVGKTSLVYHLAWMLAGMGHRVLACDLDPQANLTSAFLDENKLDTLWNDPAVPPGSTVFSCVAPLTEVGDICPPVLQEILPNLQLIAGDLQLAGFEDQLSGEWPAALGTENLYRPFRILSAFWTIMQMGAKQMGASVILADVGPNLGAINRSALIATDYVVVPLAADLFSLQGMRNLGPTLRRWRSGWEDRKKQYTQGKFPLPTGAMDTIGYVVQQHSVRLDRPVKAYDRWINKIPAEYAVSIVGYTNRVAPIAPQLDPLCLAELKHYRSLVPMAQENRKPIFNLTSADGAIGSHATAVAKAADDFRELARKIEIKARLIRPTQVD